MLLIPKPSAGGGGWRRQSLTLIWGPHTKRGLGSCVSWGWHNLVWPAQIQYVLLCVCAGGIHFKLRPNFWTLRVFLLNPALPTPHPPRAKVVWNWFVMSTLYTETSSLRTLKIMCRNLNEIVCSWIRLQVRVGTNGRNINFKRCKLYEYLQNFILLSFMQDACCRFIRNLSNVFS